MADLSDDITESECSSDHLIENIPERTKKSVVELRNTLESGGVSMFDSGVTKRQKLGMDSCSTNVTGETANFEEQCQEY
jgi:hypothetical protein